MALIRITITLIRVVSRIIKATTLSLATQDVTQLVEGILGAAIAIAIRLLTPITNHEEAEDHTAQVSHVSHAITTSHHSREQLDGSITYHEIFRLDRHRQRKDEDTLLWKIIPKASKIP